MSWGYKIAILYTAFVILILSMVGLTMRENVDLVAKDYYDQELKYQGKIDKINRANSLSEPLSWEISKDEMVIKFPSQYKNHRITGSVYFFRPSDASLDKILPVAADTSGMQRIIISQMKKGWYKMQVNWMAEQEEYYHEEIIKIN